MKPTSIIKNSLIAFFALSSAANVLPVEARANGNGVGGLYTGKVKVWTNGGWGELVVTGTTMQQCEQVAIDTIRNYTWTFPATGVSYVGYVVTPCHGGQTVERPRDVVFNWGLN